MKDKILSIISLITVFVPFTVLFVWKPTNPNATTIVMGYIVFIIISFFYTLYLFVKKRFRDIYTKVALGVNGLYLAGILVLVVIPRLF